MTMTKSERLDGLLEYLNTLSRLNEDTYRCNTEIAEAIAEIRAELGIGKTRPTLSREEISAGIEKLSDLTSR